MNSLDNETIISWIIKEASTLSWRSQFGQDVFVGQRHLLATAERWNRFSCEKTVDRLKANQHTQSPKCTHHIISSIHMKLFTQVSKDPRCIILEFKVVLDSWCKLISSTIKRYPWMDDSFKMESILTCQTPTCEQLWNPHLSNRATFWQRPAPPNPYPSWVSLSAYTMTTHHLPQCVFLSAYRTYTMKQWVL